MCMQLCPATQPLPNLSVNSPNTQYDTAGVSELRLDVCYVRWVPLGVRRLRSRKTLHGVFLPLCPLLLVPLRPRRAPRPAHLARRAGPGAPPRGAAGGAAEEFRRSNHSSVSSSESARSALHSAVIRSSDSMPPRPRSSDNSTNSVPDVWLYKFSVENTWVTQTAWVMKT